MILMKIIIRLKILNEDGKDLKILKILIDL